MKKLKKGYIFNMNWNCEICCDLCDEVIHNHFDCPVCKTKNAPTSIYHDITDTDDKIFFCEKCGSQFLWLDYEKGKILKVFKERMGLK